MRSSSQQKRKFSEVSQQQNKCTSNAVKKSGKVAVLKNQEAIADQYSRGSSQTSSTKFLKNGISDTRKPKTLELDRRTGQISHSAKIKLQLFPLTETMRSGLEKDGCNPFLELTLSGRKKISSVIKHLTAKWGSSGVAIGELMLFPFNTRSENLTASMKWTQSNSDITVGEVYVAIGGPSIFRLSYGWLSSVKLESFYAPHLSSSVGGCLPSGNNRIDSTAYLERLCDQTERSKVIIEEHRKPINIYEASRPELHDQSCSGVGVDMLGNDLKIGDGSVKSLLSWDDFTNLSIGGLLSEVSLQAKVNDTNMKSESKSGLQTSQATSGTERGGLLSEITLQSEAKVPNQCTKKDTDDRVSSIGDLLTESSVKGNNIYPDSSFSTKKTVLETNLENGALQSQFSWDENLTTLSIGGLLSEASLQEKINNFGHPESSAIKCSSQDASPISDTFDSFTAAELKSNPQASLPLSHESHTSILDAEETCSAFAFKRFSLRKDASTSSEGFSVDGGRNSLRTKQFKSPPTIEEKEETISSSQEDKENLLPHPQGILDEESSLGLSGIKWNDTRGPFDLGLPTLRSTLNDGDSINISEFVR